MDFLEDADFAAHPVGAARVVGKNRLEVAAPRIYGPSVSIRRRPSRLVTSPRISMVTRLRWPSFRSCVTTIIGNSRSIAYSSSLRRDKWTWRNATRWSTSGSMPRIGPTMNLPIGFKRDEVDILRFDLSGHVPPAIVLAFSRASLRRCRTFGLWKCDRYRSSDHGLPAGRSGLRCPRRFRHLFAEQIFDLPCGITIDAAPDVSQAEPPIICVMASSRLVSSIAYRRYPTARSGCGQGSAPATSGLERSSSRTPRLTTRFCATPYLSRLWRTGLRPIVTCLGTTQHAEHLAEFANIDISFDPFPQNGGVSTWESLQMGVPVICKLGRRRQLACWGRNRERRSRTFDDPLELQRTMTAMSRSPANSPASLQRYAPCAPNCLAG